jgi:hypothetical protein
MLAVEFQSAEIDRRRRSPRAPLSLDGQIGKSGRTLCKVIDVSRHGARLAIHSALKRGSTIWLILPELGQIAAHVRWSDDFSAGCEFEKPLDQALVDLLVEKGATNDRG